MLWRVLDHHYGGTASFSVFRILFTNLWNQLLGNTVILWVKMSLISIASHPFFYHLSLFIFLFIFYFLNIADIDNPPPSTHPIPLSSFSHTGHQCSFCLNQTPETHRNTLGDSSYSITHCQIHVKQFSTYPWEAFWSMQNSQKKKNCLGVYTRSLPEVMEKRKYPVHDLSQNR